MFELRKKKNQKERTKRKKLRKGTLMETAAAEEIQ